MGAPICQGNLNRSYTGFTKSLGHQPSVISTATIEQQCMEKTDCNAWEGWYVKKTC